MSADGPQRHFYSNGSSLSIRLETSDRASHRLVNHIAKILLQEVLGYQQTQPGFLDAYRYVVFLEQGETADELMFGNGQFGDCNRDGVVDTQDALDFAAAFHSSIGAEPFEPERYNVCFDFDLDDDIDFEDAYVFRSVWENPAPLPSEPLDDSQDDEAEEAGEEEDPTPIGTPRDDHDRQQITVVDDSSAMRYQVPADIIPNWESLTFEDSRWAQGRTPLGFASPPSPIAGLVRTDVARSMLGLNSTVYVRIPFDVADISRVDAATLSLQYDDGFVAYVNGRAIASRNAPGRLSALRVTDSTLPGPTRGRGEGRQAPAETTRPKGGVRLSVGLWL